MVRDPVDLSFKKMEGWIQDALAAHIAHEASWLPHDHRGRWVVIEPGAGRFLRTLPRALRSEVDELTPRRARRFSSRARARAFAREVGGDVRHWRRRPPSGSLWRRQSPWQRALDLSAPWLPYLPTPTEI